MSNSYQSPGKFEQPLGIVAVLFALSIGLWAKDMVDFFGNNSFLQDRPSGFTETLNWIRDNKTPEAPASLTCPRTRPRIRSTRL
jgi:hypothetical protein